MLLSPASADSLLLKCLKADRLSGSHLSHAARADVDGCVLLQIAGTGNGTNQTAFVAVAAGRYHSVGLDSWGRVYTWGLNDYGQLGRTASTASDGVSHWCSLQIQLWALLYAAGLAARPR